MLFADVTLYRPLSNPHDIMQLMGRGGRGPNIWDSSIEIVWNNSDLSHNVPGIFLKAFVGLGISLLYLLCFSGMSTHVRNILDPTNGCIAKNLCDIFSYQFDRILSKCCSHCHKNV